MAPAAGRRVGKVAPISSKPPSVAAPAFAKRAVAAPALAKSKAGRLDHVLSVPKVAAPGLAAPKVVPPKLAVAKVAASGLAVSKVVAPKLAKPKAAVVVKPPAIFAKWEMDTSGKL